MTEIQEMAQAIYEKHKALWPLTWAVADFMAKQLAGDQGYLIVNQLTHELMGLSTKQAEIPTTKHKPHCLLLDPEEPQCHCSCGLEPAPAQDERLRAAFMEGYQQGIDSEFSDPEAAWNRSRTIHLALDLEQARPAQTEQQPEQDDSLNMEPEGANAYLVVDPEDNYHICYVVRSKGQALQHATDGLLAFGPITQGNDS